MRRPHYIGYFRDAMKARRSARRRKEASSAAMWDAIARKYYWLYIGKPTIEWPNERTMK